MPRQFERINRQPQYLPLRVPFQEVLAFRPHIDTRRRHRLMKGYATLDTRAHCASCAVLPLLSVARLQRSHRQQANRDPRELTSHLSRSCFSTAIYHYRIETQSIPSATRRYFLQTSPLRCTRTSVTFQTRSSFNFRSRELQHSCKFTVLCSRRCTRITGRAHMSA